MYNIFNILKGKCFLISSTIIIFIFIFISNTMSKAYVKKEKAYRTIISKLLTDKNYFNSFKKEYGDYFINYNKEIKAPEIKKDFINEDNIRK